MIQLIGKRDDVFKIIKDASEVYGDLPAVEALTLYLTANCETTWSRRN